MKAFEPVCVALLVSLALLTACGGEAFEAVGGDAAVEAGAAGAAGGSVDATGSDAVDDTSERAVDDAARDAATRDASTSDAARDAATCAPACGPGRACCGGRCVNLANDPAHCGACGSACGGATPFCDGTCKATPCGGSATCGDGACCGMQCCAAGQICCATQGPLAGAPQCETPTAEHPTCSQGCAPLCISDRAVKHDITAVDALSVLERVSRLPVATWSYNSEPAGIRHMGPMAQDFKAAFGLGDTDKAYYAVDAHGVTLAAIQALYELNLQQASRVERIERENVELRAQMTQLLAR